MKLPPWEQGSGSSDGKRRQPLILTPGPPRAPQRHAPVPLCASHSVDVSWVTRAAFCGGWGRALCGRERDVEFCPRDLATFCVFKALLLDGSQPENLGTVSYLLSSRKILAWGCGQLKAVGACLPSALRDDVRSFQESDSVRGEAEITPATQGKQGSSKGNRCQEERGLCARPGEKET